MRSTVLNCIFKELKFEDYEIEFVGARKESYSEASRNPTVIEGTLKDDQNRRDFTINALAYDPINNILVDEYNGQNDLKKKIITTVGDPKERFTEDSLRILRAVRFSAQLGFSLEPETMTAIKKLAPSLSHISKERIRDELLKIIDAPYAMDAFIVMNRLGILAEILPELEEGIGCEQGGTHSYDVWTHLLKSLEHGTNKNYPLSIKIAALFHDIGKPRTRRKANGRGSKEWTFYGHEVVGAKMTKDIMKRLKFPNIISEPVIKLVRYHMFFSDPDEITLSAVRRMIKNVGKDLIWDLMDLRTCDRIGTGRPKEKPYRLRKYHAMIEEVMRDPISVGMLKINGDYMIQDMDITPGKRMGWMLHALLEEVLDDPTKNNEQWLKEKVIDLNTLKDKDLQKLGEAGKDKREEKEYQAVKKLHRKHNVD